MLSLEVCSHIAGEKLKIFHVWEPTELMKTKSNIQKEDQRIMTSFEKHFFPKFSMCGAE